jgi:hypothetical protein
MQDLMKVEYHVQFIDLQIGKVTIHFHEEYIK